MRGKPAQRTAFSVEEIEKHMGQLRPHHAAVLERSNDLSYEGIAAELNISRGTVKSRLNRGRAALARLIEQDRTSNAGT